MGDLIDCGIKDSIGASVYENRLTPQEQIDMLVDLLRPIADRIDGYVQGNHEYRTTVLSGLDPLRYVASRLGLLDSGRYTDNTYILDLSFGRSYGHINKRNHYIVYGTHGCQSGGRTMGATANALEAMGGIVANADLYLHSHTHATINYTKPILTYNATSGSLMMKNRTGLTGL